jgi:phosphatidylglycerol---prolipoprotein diacylglyceryl transferase
MREWYQNIPILINPIVFHLGPLEVRWYALMYLVGFLAVYLMLAYFQKNEKYSREFIFDFLLYSVTGLLIGARLGYVFFYAPQYFWQHPAEIIIPYDFGSRVYSGISGMSYFGGLIGASISAIFFLRKKKIAILEFSEWLMPAVPVGYFFGRLGNFLNGELYGRPTNFFLGMYFSTDPLNVLRHPNQLYEAFFEGAVIFLILLAWSQKSKSPGFLLGLYLFSYGLFRFFLEFLREPESAPILLNTLDISQLFSLILILFSLGMLLYLGRKKCYNSGCEISS